MENNALILQQFITLREEIKATKARIFWIVAMGLFGVPLITYLAESIKGALFLTPMVPYVVLVLIVMFIAEHTALMRAGQYIRRKIEPNSNQAIEWETWLESNTSARLLDKHFVAVFVLVFFVYYFMSIGFAIQTLQSDQGGDPLPLAWTIAAGVTYVVGLIWTLSTLLQHWKSATGTTAME